VHVRILFPRLIILNLLILICSPPSYYLQQYGTVEDLIQFWLRHNLLEDAVRHVLANQLDSKLFLDVVLHALSRNMLSKLKDILGKLGADYFRPFFFTFDLELIASSFITQNQIPKWFTSIYWLYASTLLPITCLNYCWSFRF
jgi:hypothetical protein